MAKKISFDGLPSAVERILSILSSEDSEHTALPQLTERIALLEKKIDHLQRTVSPDKPVMDMHEVCRALKLRPKAVSELARSGVLPSRDQGRKTVFYEDGVVKYFMSGAAWKEATAQKEKAAEPKEETESESPSAQHVRPEFPAATSDGSPAASPATSPAAETGGRRRVDVGEAAELTNRNPAAIYQLIKSGNIPYYKDGRKVYFYSDELSRWSEAHPARKYKKRNS